MSKTARNGTLFSLLFYFSSMLIVIRCPARRGVLERRWKEAKAANGLTREDSPDGVSSNFSSSWLIVMVLGSRLPAECRRLHGMVGSHRCHSICLVRWLSSGVLKNEGTSLAWFHPKVLLLLHRYMRALGRHWPRDAKWHEQAHGANRWECQPWRPFQKFPGKTLGSRLLASLFVRQRTDEKILKYLWNVSNVMGSKFRRFRVSILRLVTNIHIHRVQWRSTKTRKMCRIWIKNDASDERFQLGIRTLLKHCP